MKKTDIERIIKQGSIRQKIKLYFTDVAYFNTKGLAQAEFKSSGDSQRMEVKDQILTDRERDLIWNSIKEPKDIKYYEELRKWNKAFLMFKPEITIFTKNFLFLTAQLSKPVIVKLLHTAYRDTINDMLEEVEEDKKLREKLVNIALESLNRFGFIRYQEEGFLPFIQIENHFTNTQIWEIIELLNEKIKEAKEYIESVKFFINENLPLQPYKEFLKKAEDTIKKEIEKCRNTIEDYILCTHGFGRQTNKNIIDVLKKIERENNEIIEPNLNKFIILNWEDVKVEVTDEDIEDIKNAGI